MIERDIKEEKQVSANPSSPRIRIGLGRAELGLGCAIIIKLVMGEYQVIQTSFILLFSPT